MSIAISTALQTSFADAVARTREALAAQGFGVLTEIDMKATLKKKLDTDMEDYLILGACNPPLAHRAVTVDRQIGLLLPCNVVMHTDPADDTRVLGEAMDPQLPDPAPGNPASSSRNFGPLSINPDSREVFLDDEPIHLTRTEFDILAALSSRPCVVWSRRQLIDEVWGEPWVGNDHLVDVHDEGCQCGHRDRSAASPTANVVALPTIESFRRPRRFGCQPSQPEYGSPSRSVKIR